MVQNKVTNDTDEQVTCRLRDLDIGAIAVDVDGNHYMRTCIGATCLRNGDTFTFGCGEWGGVLEPVANESTGPSLRVRPLPKGTRVYIDVQ